MRRLWRWIGVLLGLGLVAGGIALYPHRHYVVARDWPAYDYGRPDRERLEPLTLLNHERVMGEILGEPLIPVERIAILAYPGAETIEVVAPMAAFSELMSVQIDYVAPAAGTVRTSQVDLVVEKTLEDIESADVLVVPGGSPEAVQALRADPRVAAWLSRIDASSRLTLVTGAGASLLGGTPVDVRYVQDGKRWTAGRGTAALDAALAMVGAIAGNAHLQAAMLDLEYDPAPTAFPRGTLASLEAAGPLPPPEAPPVRIGILVYDGFFTLDAIGPLAMLSQLDGVSVELIRRGESPVVRSGRTRLQVATAINDVDAIDVLIVPGGADGTWTLGQDDEALAWIRRIDDGSRITASVCTGSWVLGEAGLLQGRRATSNWYRASDMMARYGATFVPERHVRDGKLWTSAGVSAGLDLSVALGRELRGDLAAARMVERMDYWPEPPIRAGSPAATDERVLDMMHQMYDAMMMPLITAED
jgi:putative intracellular protease/amidase